MFAERLSPLIDSFPEEADALRRIAAYLADMEARRPSRFYALKLNPTRLYDISQAGSSWRLTRVIEILICARIFERRIAVKFPEGSQLHFKSYADLPEIVRDPDRDVDMEVSEENIEPQYILVKDEHSQRY